jgi:3-isopropylmalate dehydratase small subunit
MSTPTRSSPRATSRPSRARASARPLRQHALREDGSEKPDFVLNQETLTAARRSCIAYENFGCGSRAEHAPWALLDFGIRCVIAPDFADIFHNNCFKNGILPVPLAARGLREADG